MDPIEIIKKFYPPDSRAFRILVRHSRLVANKAVAVARRVPHLKPDIGFIEEAAMLHDIGICRTNTPDFDCHGENPYICHGVLGRELLEGLGLPRHALVCERHVGTGISAEDIQNTNLPLPCRDMLPVTLEEQIICYADKFFSKSSEKEGKEKSLKKILKGLSAHGQEKAEKFMEWHERFE